MLKALSVPSKLAPIIRVPSILHTGKAQIIKLFTYAHYTTITSNTVGKKATNIWHGMGEIAVLHDSAPLSLLLKTANYAENS